MTDYIREAFDQSSATFREGSRDAIHQFGSATHALLYSHLFLPDFLEVDGSILLDRKVPNTHADFLKAKEMFDGTLEQIESSFNDVEVAYLFSQRTDISEKVEMALANAIADAWRGRLLYLFPGRQFSVYLIDPEESGSVVCVGFHEIRSVDALSEVR